jgi:hypothetical protein
MWKMPFEDYVYSSESSELVERDPRDKSFVPVVSVSSLISTVIALVIVMIVIHVIISSSYVLAFSSKNFLMVGAALVALSKLSMCLHGCGSPKALLLLGALIIVGTLYIVDSKVSDAKIGAIILGLTFFVDMLYMIISYVSLKKPIGLYSFIANIVGDALLAGLLFYSVSTTN